MPNLPEMIIIYSHIYYHNNLLIISHLVIYQLLSISHQKKKKMSCFGGYNSTTDKAFALYTSNPGLIPSIL